MTESTEFLLKVQSEHVCLTVRRSERIAKRAHTEQLIHDSLLRSLPKTTINAEHVLRVSSTGQFLQNSVGINQLLSGVRSKDVIIKLHITIAMNHGTFWTPNGRFSLKDICSDISNWKNLRHLSLTSTMSPAASSLSAQQQQPVPWQQAAVLPVKDFAELLLSLTRMDTLKLTGIGFVGENVHKYDYQLLFRACAAARSLRTVDIRNIYFSMTDPLEPRTRELVLRVHVMYTEAPCFAESRHHGLQHTFSMGRKIDARVVPIDSRWITKHLFQ
jgi:hypothetical protein